MSKMLKCSVCGRLTAHEYARSEEIWFQYHSTKDGHEHEAGGLKDLWKCRGCGVERVYGAPDPEKGIQVWSLEMEKECITEILKNFYSSRAVLFCSTPEVWVAGYLDGLDRRRLGFNGQAMTPREKLELKLHALKLLSEQIAASA